MSPKYKNENQIHIKRRFITAMIVLTLILGIVSILLGSISQKKQEKEVAIAAGKFNSIKDILEYYDCQYKREKKSQLEEFDLDIYAVFKYDLYDGEKSNEEFYNNIINEIAKFLQYRNFRLIDNQKQEEIEIQVIGDGNKIQIIRINGIEDYFI